MGADPNLESEDSGCTSLHFAANNDDGHLVEALVKAGAVVDAVSVELGGSTPLYVAASRYRSRTAFVPQEDVMHRELTVLENIT